jgi:hypothetical protein
VGKVTLQVNTRGFQGKITKSAQVTTNDPRQRHAKIYLSIDVRAHIVVEPGPRVILRGIVGDDIRRVVRIRAADDRPLEVTRINTNLESVIDYKLTARDGGRRYRLEVASKATGRRSASGFLALHTNHPKKKAVRLSVHVRIRPEIEFWPPRISFREILKPGRDNRPSKRILTILNNRGKSFHIRELSYNRDYFQVRSLAKNGNPARRYQFEVMPLLDRLPAGRIELQDTLTIKTDSAKAGEVKVPLSIRLRQ